MKVLVTGANGFVGSALCRETVRRGHECLALVRPASNRMLVPVRAETLFGNFTDGPAMVDLLATHHPEAIIHAGAVVSNGTPDLERAWRVNVEGTAALLAAAEAADIARWVQISSMSAHPANRSVYGGTKLACDEVVRRGATPWTILRPSLIYGAEERGIFHRMKSLIRRLPVIPMLGSGAEPMRPVHVDDVAFAALEAMERPATAGRTYCLGGPEDWTFRKLVEVLAEREGRRPMLIPIPMPLCRIAALVGEVILPETPVSSDNLEGITAAQPVDIESARRDLNFAPRAFCG